MSLPKRNVILYSLEIPSTKKKISYSPFTVGIQKQLLLAQQSENIDVMINTLKETIKQSVKENIDVDSLAIFDLEYIFLQMRAKSTDELAELKFHCDVCPIEDEKAAVQLKIDIPAIKVKYTEGHTNIIQLEDGLGIKLKYPTAGSIVNISDIDNDSELMMNIIIDSIDVIFKGDEIWPAKNYSKEELAEFMNSLYKDDLMKIVEFFDTMPKLVHNVKYNCPVCGLEHDKEIKGLTNFF